MVEILQPAEADNEDVPVLDTGSAPERAPGDGIAIIREDEDEDALPAHAVQLDDGRVRLPLLHKAEVTYRKASKGEVHREVYRELTFRRLTGADMRAIMSAGKGAEPVIVAMARSAGIHMPIMQLLYDAMDGADVSAAAQVVSYFLGNGPTTGR